MLLSLPLQAQLNEKPTSETARLPRRLISIFDPDLHLVVMNDLQNGHLQQNRNVMVRSPEFDINVSHVLRLKVQNPISHVYIRVLDWQAIRMLAPLQPLDLHTLP